MRLRTRERVSTAVSEWLRGGLPYNPNNFAIVYDTSLGGTTITLPLFGTVNCLVDWGDGLSDSYTTTGNKTHTYATGGVYIVQVSGTLTAFGTTISRPQMTSVLSFGSIGITSMLRAFRSAANFNQVPNSLPPNVSTLAESFQFATSFNDPNIAFWDVSTVTTMDQMFDGCTVFNQNVGGWVVSSVTNLSRMFRDCPAFNQDLGSWDVSSVTDMSNIFRNGTSFNQNIGSWNVKRVTTFAGALRSATSFNQNLSGWRPSRLTTAAEMFFGVTLSTTNYDALLTGWTDFTGSGWDSGSITAFADAGGGQVTVTTSAAHGYANGHVMRITGTTNYDGSYVISNVAATSFRITAAFVATETGTWNATLQSNVTFHGGNSKYSTGAATTARGVLTGAPYNWTITDGGQV
jgi:surface protein